MKRTSRTRGGAPRPTTLKAGQKFGGWTLVSRLGAGGNGEVWRATSANGGAAALKFLTKLRPVAYARFRREVAVVARAKGIEGVLPLLDTHLPATLSAATPPWFAMPVATPLERHLRDRGLVAVVGAVASLANTLSQLHALGIAHRDIKSANLYSFNNTWCVGDFGLVDYPDQLDLTGRGEEVGPKWTIAPEMRRDARLADGKPADVYSLAKVLWILVTGEPRGFEGQYVPTSESIGLRQHLRTGEYLLDLDEILVRATDHAPRNRPTMQEFVDALLAWQRTLREFHELSLREWDNVITSLFPVLRPRRASWETPAEILAVLKHIARVPHANHMFYPSGGGDDLGEAKPGRDLGTLELRAGGLGGPDGWPSILRPKSLSFESFSASLEWAYFRLELDELAPSGVYKKRRGRNREELTELAPLQYVNRGVWEEDFYGHDAHGRPKPLPKGARCVTRYFRGAFVIFAKRSTYNLASDTYDGRHNKMTSGAFRAYIARSAAAAMAKAETNAS